MNAPLVELLWRQPQCSVLRADGIIAEGI